jgi:hypothetical protein
VKNLYQIPCGKEIFTKEEFLEMLKNQKMKGERRKNASGVTNGWKSSFYMERGQG